MRDNGPLKIGLAPIKRGTTRMETALLQKQLILQRMADITPENVALVGIEDVLPEGLLYCHEQVAAVEKAFKRAGVHALFLPHCDFGCEEVVGQLAKRMGVPVLIWGNRDPYPDYPGGKDRDTQCGTLASTKALQRYGVPFSYILNTDVEDAPLKRGFADFCAVANVVRRFRGMRILLAGTRPQAFLSVIYNEDELLRRFGIEVYPWGSAAWLEAADRILAERADEVTREMQAFARQVDVSDLTYERQRRQAALVLALCEMAERHDIDGVAMECWSLLPERYGISGCQIVGQLCQRGLPCACEGDVLGAVTAVMMQAAALDKEPVFFSDITSRHPEQDNTELLWHCGPYPPSLAHPDTPPKSTFHGRGAFQLKNGPITIARLDAANGGYSLFSGEGRGVDGPPKKGNYVWLEVDCWADWEEKIVFGPYIHHVAGAYGQYSQILSEACKYLGGVSPDPMRPVKRVLG